jgi:hypothetical protein
MPQCKPREDDPREKWERFKDFTQKIAQVSKEEVDKEREKREREKKRAG